MGDLQRAFTRLPEGEAAFVGYVMGGDPNPNRSLEYARAVLEGGADVLELGVPFSDPVADGPTIQQAGIRAREAGTRVDHVLDMAGRLTADHDQPVVLMTYYNPIYRRGLPAFAEAAADAGVAGLIVPDLPLEESTPLRDALSGVGVDLVQLASPATSDARFQRLATATGGFLYLVSTFGVTGARTNVEDRTRELVQRARKHAGGTPVAVGFGVSEPQHAATLRDAGADGVVVGSAIVDRIARGVDPTEVRAFVEGMKDATRPPLS